jgi:hypothetical protein
LVRLGSDPVTGDRQVVRVRFQAFGPNFYKNPRLDYWAWGSGREVPRNNKKFMQTLETETYHTIAKEASQRGATVQELLRAVIIPEWLSENRKKWSK